jgi:hypothetical protein
MILLPHSCNSNRLNTRSNIWIAGSSVENSRPDSSLVLFGALLVGALVFVYATGRLLPATVASHFDAAGVATGFLPRPTYLLITVAMVLLPPILLVVVPRRTFRNPNARINLPNHRYWLSAERRAATIEILARQCTRFAQLLLAFLCYGHWLIVRANLTVPPTWSTGWFLTGLVVFLGLTVRWTMHLLGRFRID